MRTERRTETQRLLHVFDIGKGKGLRLGKRAVPADVIGGWDEMQGYGENVYGGMPGYDTVGLSWGDVGHGLNLALNPVAQYHALQRAWGGGGARPPAQPQMMQRPMQQQMPPAPMLPPGAVQALQSGPRRLLSYMGLGSHTFVAAAPTFFQFSGEPQAAFRGRRLVISQAKTAGAAGIACTITSPLTVSGIPQTPAPDQPAPVEMFAADTTYSMLDLQIAQAATQINITISVSAAPTGADTVTVTAGLYGEWLR